MVIVSITEVGQRYLMLVVSVLQFPTTEVEKSFVLAIKLYSVRIYVTETTRLVSSLKPQETGGGKDWASQLESM